MTAGKDQHAMTYNERHIYIALLVLALLAFVLIITTPIAVSKTEAQVTEEDSVTLLRERVVLVTDSIKETEGRCGNGGSGERGCFQYQPSTWNAYSLEVAGEVLPMTEENERYVTEKMVEKWMLEGVSERGIFLTWNQGSPTGWGGGTDCYSGVNKYGVPYDSCDYAERALRTLEEKSREG